MRSFHRVNRFKFEVNNPSSPIESRPPIQASWFVAFLTLDQMRIESLRDGLAPCLVHKDFDPSPASQKEWGKEIITKVQS